MHCCAKVICLQRKRFDNPYLGALNGKFEEFSLSSPVTEVVTDMSEPITPATSRLAATEVSGAGQAQTVTEDDLQIFGSDLGPRVLQALSSVREFTQGMIE